MSDGQNQPCPFCGGKCDPEGWLRGDGVRGPECEDCGATAASIEEWNTRKTNQTPVAVTKADHLAGEFGYCEFLTPVPYGVKLYAAPHICMGCVDLSSRVRELEHKMDYHKDVL